MKQRIIFGTIAGIVFLTALLLGGYWFTILISAMCVLGYREFIRLNGFSTRNLQAMVGYLILLYLVFPWKQVLPGLEANLSIVSWLYLLFLLLSTVLSKNKLNIENIAIYFLAFMYISLGFKYMIDTIWLDSGKFWALLIFACIWATDTGAYFAGVLFGKRPLWPSISPKKTIEGALGGMVLAVMVGIIFSLVNSQLLPFMEALFLAIIISILGQSGDLIQSAYKRHRNIKDSGRILPGHGGILDRTDSWIIVFPFMHLIFFQSGWLGA